MDKRMNNKGQVTIFVLVGLLIIFLGAILIVVLGFFSTNLNSALDIDVDLGQVNLRTVNAQTIGQFNLMVTNHADFWGICIIFGMILGLFAGAYFTRNTAPRVGIILDLFIILLAFIVSLYMKAIYSDVITTLNRAGQTFALDYMVGTNYFILNLPIFIAIIGVIAMVLFHSSIPRKSEELNVVPEIVTG